MIQFWRIFVASWKNLARNTWIALATVFVFTMALTSVNVLLGVDAMVNSAVKILENKVDVTVAFKPDTPAAVVRQANFYLTSLPQVAEASVIQPDQVLSAFQSRHVSDPKVLSALTELGGNPFGAQLVVKAKHADDYPILVQAIQNPQYASFIQSQTYDDHEATIMRVREIGYNVRLVGAILVALFALFGLLIAFNAIRVAIYTQREEIAIMWLVGASPAYIRSPFILEGVWLALLGTLVAVGILFPAILWIEPVLRPVFDGADPGLMSFFITQGPHILLLEGGSLLLLTMVIGWMTVGRYIKK